MVNLWLAQSAAPWWESPNFWISAVGGPIATLFVGICFVWLIPRAQRKASLAFELFKMYHTTEMQTARKQAFEYFHNVPASAKLEDRIRAFWEWTTDPTSLSRHAASADVLQSAQKIFSFFAACESCLAEKQASRKLLHSLIGHQFSRWSLSTIEPMVRRGFDPAQVKSGFTKPAWFDGMPRLRKACGHDAPLELKWPRV